MTAAHDRRLSRAAHAAMTAVHEGRSYLKQRKEREKDLCLKPPLMTAVFDRRS